jgi:hypothetical protein
MTATEIVTRKNIEIRLDPRSDPWL